MKLFYTVTDVKLMQMDHDLKMRSAELDARAALQKKDVQLDGERSVQQAAYNTMQLRLETKNAQDAAQSVITNAKNVAELTEKLAVAQARLAEKEAMLTATNTILAAVSSEKLSLLATVTELAKKPVIITKETQTAIAPQVFLPGANTPIQIVK